MNEEEFENTIDKVFGKYFRMLMFLAERGIATEKELKECFPKSAETLNRDLPGLINLELVKKRRNLLKQKEYAHYIYISTPKLFDLIQDTKEMISRILPSNQTISKEIPDFVKISEA